MARQKHSEVYLEERLEWHAPEATKRSKHAQGSREVLLEVVLGPIQSFVCRHFIKRIEVRLDQSRQLIHFVSCEDMLQHFPNDGCVRLQAFPGRVRPTFVSEQRVNQGMAVRDEVKGLRCVDVEMLLVRLFAFSLRIDLGY